MEQWTAAYGARGDVCAQGLVLRWVVQVGPVGEGEGMWGPG
jgi:hypothetical protein